jgi:hypothetical protein
VDRGVASAEAEVADGEVVNNENQESQIIRAWMQMTRHFDETFPYEMSHAYIAL